jgi:type IV pilus assembly protein PilO
MKKFSINLKDPRLRVPLLILAIVGGGTYFWYDQMYTPLTAEYTKLDKELTAKKDTLRTIQALKPQLAQLRAELGAAQYKLDSLKSIFPDQKEVPKLIREITSVARASGITTTRFNPMPDVEREYYIENRYSIMVEGRYHDLADFYAFLANFTLIINLSSMHIATNPILPESSAESGYDHAATVVASFEMTTFSSKK